MPDTGGREFWMRQVLQHGDIALALDLAASAEYFRNATARYP